MIEMTYVDHYYIPISYSKWTTQRITISMTLRIK